MDSNSTGQPLQTTASVRRVAIIGSPPGLGLGPTLLASSPRFRVNQAGWAAQNETTASRNWSGASAGMKCPQSGTVTT
jgi:hypothetical protein